MRICERVCVSVQCVSVYLFWEPLLSRGCVPAESCLSVVFVYLAECREGQGRDKCRPHRVSIGLGGPFEWPHSMGAAGSREPPSGAQALVCILHQLLCF